MSYPMSWKEWVWRHEDCQLNELIERERERQRDRQTERDRDREGERETDRQAETER